MRTIKHTFEIVVLSLDDSCLPALFDETGYTLMEVPTDGSSITDICNILCCSIFFFSVYFMTKREKGNI